MAKENNIMMQHTGWSKTRFTVNHLMLISCELTLAVLWFFKVWQILLGAKGERRQKPRGKKGVDIRERGSYNRDTHNTETTVVPILFQEANEMYYHIHGIQPDITIKLIERIRYIKVSQVRKISSN